MHEAPTGAAHMVLPGDHIVGHDMAVGKPTARDGLVDLARESRRGGNAMLLALRGRVSLERRELLLELHAEVRGGGADLPGELVAEGRVQPLLSAEALGDVAELDEFSDKSSKSAISSMIATKIVSVLPNFPQDISKYTSESEFLFHSL